MSSPFAVAADVRNFVSTSLTLPADAELTRMIARAQYVVTMNAGGWDVDTSGNATDVSVQATLKDATCAQVEMWLEMGEAVDIETWPTSTTAYQSGGVSVAGPPAKLAYRAFEILSLAGLFGAVGY